MSNLILGWSLMLAQGMIGIAMLPALWRMLIGPRAEDRVLAMDSLYVCAMLELLLFGMRSGTMLYFEAALIIGVLGFVSTLALAKFLMRGEVIE